MPNALSKVFVVILSVLVLYYVPTYQIYKKQEDLAYANTYQVVTEFVDNVRMKGFITPQMYDDFQAKLHVGDVLYDVQLVHQHKVYSPIYSDPSNANSFTGKYDVQYDEFYWEQIEPYLYGTASSPDYKERKYKLESGDFFEVYVENKTKFKSTMLFDFLTGGLGSDGVVISIPYGGMVLNEDY